MAKRATVPPRPGSNEPPKIIVKKIYEAEHGHHGGAWKVAYADFVTAMMAFFLLMWLLGATVDGTLRGIVHYIYHRSCWTVGDYCYLQDLFVAPEARKLGLGRALIEAVMAGVSAGVLATGVDRTITIANSSAARLLGADALALIEAGEGELAAGERVEVELL